MRSVTFARSRRCGRPLFWRLRTCCLACFESPAHTSTGFNRNYPHFQNFRKQKARKSACLFSLCFNFVEARAPRCRFIRSLPAKMPIFLKIANRTGMERRASIANHVFGVDRPSCRMLLLLPLPRCSYPNFELIHRFFRHICRCKPNA